MTMSLEGGLEEFEEFFDSFLPYAERDFYRYFEAAFRKIGNLKVMLVSIEMLEPLDGVL